MLSGDYRYILPAIRINGQTEFNIFCCLPYCGKIKKVWKYNTCISSCQKKERHSLESLFNGSKISILSNFLMLKVNLSMYALLNVPYHMAIKNCQKMWENFAYLFKFNRAKASIKRKYAHCCFIELKTSVKKKYRTYFLRCPFKYFINRNFCLVDFSQDILA